MCDVIPACGDGARPVSGSEKIPRCEEISVGENQVPTKFMSQENQTLKNSGPKKQRQNMMSNGLVRRRESRRQGGPASDGRLLLNCFFFAEHGI